MSINEITGDALKTRVTTDTYRDNYDRIFGKKRVQSQTTESDELKAEIERVQADAQTFQHSNSRT